MKYFYEKNTYLLNHEVNKTFDEILQMDDIEFERWVIDLRKTVVYAWDVLGNPPTVGYTEQEILDAFNEMVGYPTHKFEVVDELTGESNVIRNTSNYSGYINAFFPTMMKTRINYSNDVNAGLSIYDFFADPKLLPKFMKYARRHFKRDSFYAYSRPILAGTVLDIGGSPVKVMTGKQLIDAVNQPWSQYGYWLQEKDESDEYTGYNVKLQGKKYLTISQPGQVTLGSPDNLQIRIFEKGQKLFPVGLKAFRVSFCQYAVNFPPLTAKYLYEKYTNHIKTQDRIVIYDPSMGWAGRLIGAMSVKDDRVIHYIGTDPNTDHNTSDGRTKYHEVADFYNTKTYRANGIFSHTHTYETWQLGSEVIASDKRFQQYRGKVDLVFTSPPYFAKEVYSSDPEQSCHKFGTYSAWRDGFLRPTLETAVEWLKSDGYLLWNTSDVQFGKDVFPLVEDSISILRELGMEYVTTLKMALSQMPGGNRIDAISGLPKARYYCKVNGLWLKFEPITVWRKP